MKFFMIRLNGRLSKVSTAALRDEATGGIYFLKKFAYVEEWGTGLSYSFWEAAF